MIRITTKGSFKNIEAFGARIKRQEHLRALQKYGPIGVTALSNATPKDTGEVAASWYYEIKQRPGYFAIHWYNSFKNQNVPIAAILQYGHGTRNGGWVEGIDYINPAMRPIFEQIVADMWKVVTK